MLGNVTISRSNKCHVQVVHDYTVEHGAYPSPLRYHNFPKAVCTSVNEVVCHGIPDARELQDGDIVNVDVSCYLNGYHGDLNETFVVGNVDAQSKKLVKVWPVNMSATQPALQAQSPSVGNVNGLRCRQACRSVS